MSVIWALILLFLLPGLCLIAWLAISSCMGARLRAHLSKRDLEGGHPKDSDNDHEGPEFDKHYFQAMAQGGAALDEFIEMRNLMEDPPGEEYD